MHRDNFIKSIVILLLIVTVSFTITKVASANGGFSVTVDGENVNFPKGLGYPEQDNGRVYIPLRVISENMGYDVTWEQATRTVTIKGLNKMTKEDVTVKLVIGDHMATRNGKKIPIDVRDGKIVNTKSYIKNDRTYVPARFVTEAFDGKIIYRNVDGIRYIAITTNGDEPVIDIPEEPKEDDKPMTPEEFFGKVRPQHFGFEATKNGFNLVVAGDALDGYKFNFELEPEYEKFFHGEVYNISNGKWQPYNTMKSQQGRTVSGATQIFSLSVLHSRHENGQEMVRPENTTIKAKVTFTKGDDVQVYEFNLPLKGRNENQSFMLNDSHIKRIK